MSESKMFPVLFKKTSTGKQQQWEIFTKDNAIVTQWGQTGGAIQETTDVIATGKNVGKKNETTPTQQAQLEAQSQWEKKLKKGYMQTADAAMAGEVDALIEGGIAVMLAYKFSEQGHKIKYPAYADPKLDGHRMICVMREGKATLWSRTRKRITSLPHIERAVERAALTWYGDDADLILDGEAYVHSYRDRFEELTSFIRQETPKPGHDVVEYHVYDTPSCKAAYSIRRASLTKFSAHWRSELQLVETSLVVDEDELMEAFDRFRAQGYEGTMVRNAASLYVGKRSYDLQKLKEFEDREFCIVDVEEGRGKLAGHAIFVCEVGNGEVFRVKLKGETSELKKYFEHPELAIGKQLTVRYQGLTKNDIPRFPVGERIREDL